MEREYSITIWEGGIHEQNSYYPINKTYDIEGFELIQELSDLQKQRDEIYNKQESIDNKLFKMGISLLNFKKGDNVFLVGNYEGWHRVTGINNIHWTTHENGIEICYEFSIQELGKKRQAIGRTKRVKTYYNKNMFGVSIDDVLVREVETL